ncbi:MAG: LLM class flavin-dependent oxidoreductase [Acidimicrobiia bacterium]|nr:LLM class flavin-dependent oxidoreductase [Acidimicrobiia bacterium]
MTPPVKLHWFLPTGGDSRELAPSGPTDHRREPSADYLTSVAQAAEHLGFDAMLTPAGSYCEDAWVATASLLGRTDRIRFLVAFRPGSISPTLAAQMAATYQRMSGGRLLLNVVTGAEARELARFGDWVDHDERYARTAEFLTVLRGAWDEVPFDFEGTHYRVAGATTRAVPDPRPAIYFGGASPAAEQVAADHADVYLAWGEPPEMVGERLERVRALAEERGRSLRFGIRFHVITRPTADAAWAEAERLLAGLDPEQVAAAQADFSGTASVGQARMASLHGGRMDQLEVYPNVWAGVGLVRGGAGTALVGSHQQVAERIAEYHRLGFEEFILSGYPHLEEAYWVGEGLMAELSAMGILGNDTARDAGTWAMFR